MGYDVHPLTEGRELWLGGVRLHHPQGLLGHSDADVLLHALADALLGALALGDIGLHFPNNDDRWKGADSKLLLAETYKLVLAKGYALVNADCTVLAEAPRLRPYVTAMQNAIAGTLSRAGGPQLAVSQVSIKATTTEKLGFVGRQEGMAAQAVVLLAPFTAV